MQAKNIVALEVLYVTQLPVISEPVLHRWGRHVMGKDDRGDRTPHDRPEEAQVAVPSGFKPILASIYIPLIKPHGYAQPYPS